MSKNVSFVKTAEELAALRELPSLFMHQKQLRVYWLISRELYAKLLPPGLEPATLPLATAVITVAPHPGLCLAPLKYGGLFLACSLNGEPGSLCMALPIDAPNLQAVAIGRQILGYPSKKAAIRFRRAGERVMGDVSRYGVSFFSIAGEIGAYNSPLLADILGDRGGADVTESVFQLDYKTSLDDTFNLTSERGVQLNNIRLLRQKNRGHIFSSEPFTAELFFEESEDDGWAELKPECVLGGEYLDVSTELMGSDVVLRYGGERFAEIIPYGFFRYDTVALNKRHEWY